MIFPEENIFLRIAPGIPDFRHTTFPDFIISNKIRWDEDASF